MKCTFNDDEYKCEPRPNGFLMKYAAMYESPAGDERAIEAIREHFGATRVDEGNGISEAGCETCDHGSLYGWELLVVKPTKNLPT